jgi:hypothetical protein
MYSIDYLKTLSNLSIKKWMHEHMYDEDGNLGQAALHHEMINGKMRFRMISFDDFFQKVESHLNSDEVTFNFTGCGIKGPYNLYMTIKNNLNIEYLNYFPTELKYKIIEHTSHHEYFKNIYNSYYGELPETKILLGIFYLSYLLDNKNEIYDIVLDYKMKVIQYNFDM